MSCGISTSFPVLSPTVWQVAHALLTRPPLIRPRRDFTVRLECVMHAASVHPEPGSNSLKNCISTGFPRIDPNLLDVRSFALITQSFFKFKRIFGVFVHRCCSIFNEPTAASLAVPRSVTACLFYHSQELLSTPFQNFFQSFFCGSPPEDSSPRQLPYSITSDQHCQGFFEDFPQNRELTEYPFPYSSILWSCLPC